MPEAFPPAADVLLASLIEIFKHQRDPEVLRVLEAAKPLVESIDSDNWDRIDVYGLVLEIPLSLFAVVETERDNLEKGIGRTMRSMLRPPDGAALNRVSIVPTLKAPESRKLLPIPSDEDLDRIWDPGCFRLFLSHVSSHKEGVSQLKNELMAYRISGFVAHEDIEPTKEWMTEIELALNSAHALAALVTPDFHESKWTDQEVGIALGKGILVTSIKIGCDPYGFMGKSQSLSGTLTESARLAADLVAVFLRNSTTSKIMHEMLTVAFERARSFASAKAASHAIVKADGFTQEQLDRIRAACDTNGQVKGAFNVPERIATYLSKLHRQGSY